MQEVAVGAVIGAAVSIAAAIATFVVVWKIESRAIDRSLRELRTLS